MVLRGGAPAYMAKITPQVIALKALEVSEGFEGKVKEDKGKNRSKQLDSIEALYGLRGEAYCKMGVNHCYLKAIAFLTGRSTDPVTLRAILHNELPFLFSNSTGCTATMNVAKARKSNVIGHWETNFEKFEKGDPVCFQFDEDNESEHIGLFKKRIYKPDPKTKKPILWGIETSEWNTSPGKQGSQADGDGVWSKIRELHLIFGAIRINAPLDK